MDLPLLYSSRPQIEQGFIKNVCSHVLSQEIPKKEAKNILNWGFVFVEGRPDVEINKLEHYACFHSCKIYSKGEYPIFCFVNNVNNFLNNNKDLIKKYNIKIIQIGTITSLEQYSKFMIQDLFYELPQEIEHIFTVSADSFLLKSGAEDWILNNDFSLIGGHWQHRTQLQVIDGEQKLSMPFPSVYGCNLGFSYRQPHKMRAISNNFSMLNLTQIGDTNCPEDSFYSYLGFGSKICKLPTMNEMDIFSKDPLTLDIWNSLNKPFGFHYFRTQSEFPPCNHG